MLPYGLAVGCSKPYPGSVSVITIFRRRMSIHRQWTEKKDDENEKIEDFGEICSDFPKTWAIHIDKGYCGLHLDIRAIIPKKRSTSASLSNTDKSRNVNITHYRVIVENFLGRLCTFGLFAQKWRWDESKYEMFFKTGIALTNIHIIFHSLRASDRSLATPVQNCLVSIVDDIKSKRAASRASYRVNRKRLLYEVQSHGEETVSDSDFVLNVEEPFVQNDSVE